jgi:hypothetical protein
MFPIVFGIILTNDKTKENVEKETKLYVRKKQAIL